MDFGALPPEINSLRMYTGPGAGPMMAAAAAWNNLAAELGTTAASSQSVVAELTGTEWLGPSSASMVAATTPYLRWMQNTAGQLQQAATQAMASAAAYETAFAMTVPPPVIAANRTLLAALVATNILGQNTPAIAATEAHYAEMWAQDAAAMYGYAGSSAAASKLPLLAAPAPTTSGTGLASQAAAVTGAGTGNAQTGLQGLISTLPSAVQSFASPVAASPAAGGLSNLLGNNVVSAAGNGIFDTAAWNMMEGIATGTVFGATVNSSSSSAAADGLGAGLGVSVLAGAPGPAAAVGLGGLGGVGGAPVLATAGQASSVGGLSVPASWTAATPESATGAATLTGAGWTVDPESAPMTTVPAGMPAMAAAGRGGFGFGGPRYGVKPTVMPKPVGVG